MVHGKGFMVHIRDLQFFETVFPSPPATPKAREIIHCCGRRVRVFDVTLGS